MMGMIKKSLSYVFVSVDNGNFECDNVDLTVANKEMINMVDFESRESPLMDLQQVQMFLCTKTSVFISFRKWMRHSTSWDIR
jgi:hypothetical protein